MKSGSSSCLTTIVVIALALFALNAIRPGIVLVFLKLFTGIFLTAGLILLVALAVLGYFIFRNVKANKAKEQQRPFMHIDRTQVLFRAVMDRLQVALDLNQVPMEEMVQSQILVEDRLPDLRKQLVQLREIVSPAGDKQLNDQLRDYQIKLRQAADPSAQEVFRANLKILEEKRERMKTVAEEIRQKDATVDLVYNSLVRVEDDLKSGRPITRIFTPDVYARFGLEPPASQQSELPPLPEKSSES